MKRSTDRILTTHAGSLPRPVDLLAMGEAMQDGKPVDAATYEARLAQAVDTVVREQVERGIDIVDDGEFGKPGFAIAYRGHAQLQRDIANLRAALGAVTVEEAFMPAASPATVTAWHRKARNAHYESSLDYLFAIADALHEEYRAIVDAGFVLQIDDPGLLTYWQLRPEVYVSHQIVWSEFQVQALNHALRGIAKENIRFHTCYGINMGPRVHDMELDEFVLDVILQVHAGAISFEAANPRHEHEWQVWEKVKLPDGMVLIPGVISNSTVLVEHPELVAQRICRFANIVGRENVIAGSDGGFANLASWTEIHPTVVWAKLQALAEGARIATKKLFSPPAPLPTRRAGQRGRRPRTARAATKRSRNPR